MFRPIACFALLPKPLTCSVEAGEKILEALAASKARHFVGYHKRSDPATMYARDVMQRFKSNHEIGPLRYIRILMPAGVARSRPVLKQPLSSGNGSISVSESACTMALNGALPWILGLRSSASC